MCIRQNIQSDYAFLNIYPIFYRQPRQPKYVFARDRSCHITSRTKLIHHSEIPSKTKRIQFALGHTWIIVSFCTSQSSPTMVKWKSSLKETNGLLLWILGLCLLPFLSESFVIPIPKTQKFVLQSSPTSDDVSGMRVKEIKDELEQMNIDYTDCFDKESMVSRLLDARAGKVEATVVEEPSDEPTNEGKDNQDEEENSTSKTDKEMSFDKEATLEELRAMRVRELREELGRRQISRAGLFEKEDLIRALLEAREVASNFSITGLIMPGQVADLTGDQLDEEMKHPSTPMLLDVYATWCGPCQMMAPQLQQAAVDFGDTIRVAKMDSDKHPEMASRLKVGGLPTLVLMKNGQEIDRIEGALMKDQLIEWVNRKL